MTLFDIFLKLFEGENLTDILNQIAEERNCTKEELIKEMLKVDIKPKKVLYKFYILRRHRIDYG